MEKYIALTPSQIRFACRAVYYFVELREDVDKVASKLSLANSITDSLCNPVPVSKLLDAAKLALSTLETCRDDLAASGENGHDEICAEAKALTPAIKRLRSAIAKIEVTL